MSLTREQKTSLDKIFKRINSALSEAVKPPELEPTARFAIEVIVKRTRLGYSVRHQFGEKGPLKKLSLRYVKKRTMFEDLDALTTPKRSNLTLTGQMLKSMDIIRSENGKIRIGPTGTRRKLGNEKNTPTNAQVAAYQEGQGRTFNRVSYLEYKQILRFYRRTFGDLLGKKKLLG